MSSLFQICRDATGGSIPVAVCPNLLDYDWWRMIQKQARRIVPPVSIGWAGAHAFRHSFASMHIEAGTDLADDLTRFSFSGGGVLCSVCQVAIGLTLAGGIWVMDTGASLVGMFTGMAARAR